MTNEYLLEITDGPLKGQIVGIILKYKSEIQISKPAQVDLHIIELLQIYPCILIPCEN